MAWLLTLDWLCRWCWFECGCVYHSVFTFIVRSRLSCKYVSFKKLCGEYDMIGDSWWLCVFDMGSGDPWSLITATMSVCSLSYSDCSVCSVQLGWWWYVVVVWTAVCRLGRPTWSHVCLLTVVVGIDFRCRRVCCLCGVLSGWLVCVPYTYNFDWNI